MNIDSSRDRLVTILNDWRNQALVVEFRAGVTYVSGICVLVEVSDTELRFMFDPSASPTCELGISIDSVATFAVGSFEDAMQNILGKPRHALTREERGAFFSKGVEQVADVRFLQGARLLIGLVRASFATAQATTT